MMSQKVRELLLIVIVIVGVLFLTTMGPSFVEAGPLFKSVSAWNYLPVVMGQGQGAIATSTPEAPTATPTSTPIATLQPDPSDTGDVRITEIFFDGAVPQVESDEYVEIKNFDNKVIRIGGWKLHDEGQDHTYTFPAFNMQPNQVCRVYTNENRPEWCGFNWGNNSAIWNNTGDVATLKDSGGTVIDTCSYSGSGTTKICQ
jgi:competence protein ComEC